MTMIRSIALGFCLTAVASFAVATGSAQALTMQECSAKYKAAQAAGTTKGLKWNDFRKAECGADATAAPAAAPSTTASPKAEKKEAARPPAPAPATVPAATGNAVFPSAVSSKYSSESAGKARMHT